MDLKSKLAAAVNRAKQTPMGDGPKKKKGTGTYIATAEGRVGRINPGSYQSIDTTGYSKGKEEFTLRTSPGSGMYSDSKIKRGDVPKKIQEFKKGASKTIVYKKPSNVSTGIKKAVNKG